MTRVRLLPEAEEELRAVAQFYEALQPDLGLALLQEVCRARQRIAEQPNAAIFGYRAFFDSPIESITGLALTRLSLSQSATGGADLAFGARVLQSNNKSLQRTRGR